MMSQKKSSRRSFLGYAVTAVVVGVVAGVGGYYAGLLGAAPGPGVTTTITGAERTRTVTTTTTAGPGVPVTTTITAPPVTSTITTTVTEKPTPSWERWIEDAKKEGAFSLYVVHAAVVMDQLYATFAGRFPFLASEYWRGSGRSILAKVDAESKAGRYLGDVIWCGHPQAMMYPDFGHAAQYKSPERAAYPEDYMDKEGYYTAASRNPQSMGYNTDLVPPDKVPKSYLDLLDPYWKDGKITMQDPRAGGTLTWFICMRLGAFGEMTEEEFLEYMRGLAAQKPVIMPNPTVAMDMVIRGEAYLIVQTFPYQVEENKAKGAPVDWVRLPAIGAGFQDVVMLKGAPHPNAARLFIDWILSEEGQKAASDAGVIPARPGILPKNEELGRNLVPDLSPEEFSQRGQYWIDLAAEIFGLE